MARLPLRIRVTLTFAGAMAALLIGLSAFLVLRLQGQLDLAVRQGLDSRASDVGTLIRATSATSPARPASDLSDEDASLTQVLDARNRVLDRTPVSPRRSLLSRGQLRRAIADEITFDLRSGPERTRVRVLATNTGDGAAPARVVVVGQSLEARDEAVRQLKGQLAVAVPIALLLASLAGYVGAGVALRPVGAMTRRAGAIEAEDLDARLPVPAGGDELSELAATLNLMLDRLQTAIVHEREFVADASHELRTPLAIMSAEIQVALETVDDVDGHRDALRSLAGQTARVVRLAEDLLVLARADQGRLPMRPEPLDAATAVTAAVARFEARAAQHHLTIRGEVQPDLFIRADEVRLDQLVDNLVENALRYAASEIVVEAVRDPGAVVIRVRDDGPGFPPAFAARAFDRFAMADGARTGEHAGLGLAIVRAIATAHGWTVTMPSAGAGAVVEIRVPPLPWMPEDA